MVTAVNNQSLLDIAIQEDGSALAAADWALVNKLSITAVVVAGQKLINPNSKFKNKVTADYFKGKNHLVATDFLENTNENQPIIFGFPLLFPLSL